MAVSETHWLLDLADQSPFIRAVVGWVDLRAAYAGLPRQLRSKISGKRGIFDYAKRLAGRLTMRESMAVLSHARVHIGADSDGVRCTGG
jgi:hypothetical protein